MAVRGASTDGHRYIPDAIARGALAVVGEAQVDPLIVPYFQVNDSRLALAMISAAFFGYPSRKMTVVGVTGTDGKTTTATMIYHILKSSGIQHGFDLDRKRTGGGASVGYRLPCDYTRGHRNPGVPGTNGGTSDNPCRIRNYVTWIGPASRICLRFRYRRGDQYHARTSGLSWELPVVQAGKRTFDPYAGTNAAKK